MRQSHQLPLVGLLLFSLIPSQLCEKCEISKNDYADLDPLINTMINSKYTEGIQATNVLLSLRLAGILNQSQEQQLIQQVKRNVDCKSSNLTSGQLALAILALGACKNPDAIPPNFPCLVRELRNKFQAEIKNMEAGLWTNNEIHQKSLSNTRYYVLSTKGYKSSIRANDGDKDFITRKRRLTMTAAKEHNGNPLTNYYQLSLDVLALCLFRGEYSIKEVAEIFDPKNKNFYLMKRFSVDTGAMAVLALTCVKNTTNGREKTDTDDLNIISNHIKLLIEMILSQKKENGLLGNIYSTGEAMQERYPSCPRCFPCGQCPVNIYCIDYYSKSKWNCQQTLRTAVMEIHKGAFRMPTAAAQILPALLGKTYLNVSKDSPCVYGDFHISTVEPTTATPPLTPSQIQVNYSVVINNDTYSTVVSVANGSVFLNVMEAAQKKNETLFRFTVEESSWGPYVTSVQGLEANNNKRTFWELLSNGIPLEQGVGSYVVHKGENLEVRWSTY